LVARSGQGGEVRCLEHGLETVSELDCWRQRAHECPCRTRESSPTRRNPTREDGGRIETDTVRASRTEKAIERRETDTARVRHKERHREQKTDRDSDRGIETDTEEGRTLDDGSTVAIAEDNGEQAVDAAEAVRRVSERSCGAAADAPAQKAREELVQILPCSAM
jgi:hypothetical protein